MAARLTCYPSFGKRKGLRICQAFADSCGGLIADPGCERLNDGPAFFYGWTTHTVPLIARCVAERRTWYYADNAYYFGRGEYFRVTRKALMHDGAGAAPAWGHARVRRLGVRLQPWRQPDDEGKRPIVLATQSNLFYQMRLGMTRDAWTAKIVAQIEANTRRPVIVCHKPEVADMSVRQSHAPGLEALLADAHALVTHSSSAAVLALVEGVPVFPLAPSMVSTMGYEDLGQLDHPLKPDDRQRWIEVLLSNQWSLQEMRSGRAWQDLQLQHDVTEAWYPAPLLPAAAVE